MRKTISFLLICSILLSLFSGCAGETSGTETAEITEPIQPLSYYRSLSPLTAAGEIKPYSEYWWDTNSLVKADLSDFPALTYSLSFSDKTKFPSPSKLPAGYDPEALLEWGKYPGLNVDILHKHGFTGKGAVIAYVDQPFTPNEQYNDANIHYINNSDKAGEMHGSAVLSLLVGKDIGTAPEAEVYYYAHSAWEADQTTHAECLYQIIEQNKTLPPDQRITMVGFSDNIDSSEKNAEAFSEAVEACEDAGIMVWFCQDYAAAYMLPMTDKNDPANVVMSSWWTRSNTDAVFVPDSGRTTAAPGDNEGYIYWGQGGLSWTMPYALGLYAIAIEIDPAITKDELYTLLKETAYNGNGGMKLINPVGFIAAVLERVGRSEEGEAMLREVEARRKYIYAIMNTTAMTKEDLEAVEDYLTEITDGTVLVVEAAYFSSADEIYSAIRDDAAARGGTIDGVQIFGTSDMVPSFSVKYRAQMPDSIHEGGTFLTDLFYGNFENDPAVLRHGYNVQEHFAEGWDVQLIPQWRVARLPLNKGEFPAFFEKYHTFVKDTGLTQQDLVNFSNPIFPFKTHIDDMGTFLNRAAGELGILNTPYRLYGNEEGQYPVTTKTLGDFASENLAKENAAGPVEFIVNSHGQENNIDRCFFVNGNEQRSSFINSDNINTVLSKNPYYLNCWACLTGYGMKDNLTTTALNGKCVGMFSATDIISNNGVNCSASIENMKQSNFYYFYYTYLNALSHGASRSKAFFAAQQAYGQALMEDSRQSLRAEGNYQFNLHNLLVYHNFGVLEPDSTLVFEGDGAISPFQANPSDDKAQTDDDVITPEYTITDRLTSGKSITIHAFLYEPLGTDTHRFTLEFTAPEGMETSIYSPGSAGIFRYAGPETTGTRQFISFDISDAEWSAVREGVISIRKGYDDLYFIEWSESWTTS